ADISGDLKFVLIITLFVTVVSVSSWFLRRIFLVERKRLAKKIHFPFGCTIEYDDEIKTGMKIPDFRFYIDPGRLATTLVMKCFCTVSCFVAGFGVVLKLCLPQAISMNLTLIFLAVIIFGLPMFFTAIIHKYGNEFLDDLQENPKRAVPELMRKLLEVFAE
ncbi:MAG: hypothetical protein ABF533_11745, partial [Acetobacter persici]